MQRRDSATLLGAVLTAGTVRDESGTEVAVPHLSGLYIYPLKSARGTAVEVMDLDDRGAVDDRRWMLIDQENVFLSQREVPRLALLSPSLTSTGLRLEAPGNEPLEVSRPGEEAESVTGTVWDGSCRVRVADRNAGRWVSRFLGRPCRLVFQPDDAVLPMAREYAGAITGDRRISLTDGSPLLLIGEASLEDLNQRLPRPLPMNRFRPNMVVRGSAAYAEDAWKQIEAGGIRFEVARPCARCATTTVDQATGQRGDEPLRTLATYRKVGSHVMFGQNVAHHGPGRLRRGDPIHVLG